MALGNGIAADDHSTADLECNIPGFLVGQAGDELGRRLSRADATLSCFARRDNGKAIAPLGQKLPSARRATGKNERKVGHAITLAHKCLSRARIKQSAP